MQRRSNKIVMCVPLAVGALLALATPAAPATRAVAEHTRDTLGRGEVLRSGERLRSHNRCFTFVMQTDGNAVEYARGNVAVWSTNTQLHPGAFLTMQTDGNLVVYSRSGTPLWSSGTNATRARSFVVQDDGNDVLYAPGSQPVWWQGTTDGCAHRPAPARVEPTDSPRAEAAIAWMEAHARSTGWDGRCETAVAVAFGRVDAPVLMNAHDDWARFPVHHMDASPPRGALVFWRTSADWHVGISVGNGGVVSTSSMQYGGGGAHGIGLSPALGFFADYRGWTDNGF